MSPLQAIFLDLDGTLLDNSLHEEAIARTCEEIAAIQPELEGARLIEANRRIWEAYWPQVEEDWNLGVIDGESPSLEAWRRTLRACGCSDESVVQRAAQIHGQLGRAAYRLFNDVHEFLAAVSRAHIQLALITNGASGIQRDKLHALEIGHWFDSIIISGEVGVAKPDPKIFEFALRGLSVESKAACHVGDSLVTDVAGANAAGITSVWLNRTEVVRMEEDPVPEIEIRALSDLIASWSA